MYNKQHASQMRQLFWTTFGQYMAPAISSEGEKVNWVNYKTGQKHVCFKMDADQKTAFIGIEISHPALDAQKLYFDHLTRVKKMLEVSVNEKWEWALHIVNEEDKVVSRIFCEIDGVNIFDKDDWPRLISFFKPRILGLDLFWNNVKYGFETIQS